MCAALPSPGKHYFEVSIKDNGICRVGWSSIAGKMDLGTDPHVRDTYHPCFNVPVDHVLRWPMQGFGYGGTAKKAHNRRFDDYGRKFGKGDTIGCLLDLDDGRSVTFMHNGSQLPKAYDLPKNMQGPLYPTVCMKNSCMAVNFGGTPFKHPPPSGYTGARLNTPCCCCVLCRWLSGCGCGRGCVWMCHASIIDISPGAVLQAFSKQAAHKP